jgi:TrmH family RNA methyltransferase
VITSSHNEKLKEVRKLLARRRARELSGRFVAEGEDLLAAADAAGWAPAERYCTAGSGLRGVEVEPRVLASVSGLASGTRALAVYEERWAPAPIGPLCVYLHGVHDPGNVGAVLRSAEAFGASCVALGPGSADPFGPKAVRASMGAVFTVPLARVSPGPGLGALPGSTVALVAGAGVPIRELWRSGSGPPNQSGKDRSKAGGGTHGQREAESPEAVTLLVGSERDGLPEALVEAAEHVAHIPIATHSLNAATAAAVALYELAHRMPTR